MKTLDFLVKELPKLGGWPDGAIGAGFLCGKGTLYFGMIVMTTHQNGESTRRLRLKTLRSRCRANSTKLRWQPKMTAGLSGVVVSVRLVPVRWLALCLGATK